MSKQNDTTKYVLRHKGYNDESLWIYRNGSLSQMFSVDNTSYAVAWCNEHGMAVDKIVRADNGKLYAIWTGDHMACAIPVRNEAAVIGEVENE